MATSFHGLVSHHLTVYTQNLYDHCFLFTCEFFFYYFSDERAACLSVVAKKQKSGSVSYKMRNDCSLVINRVSF